MRKTVLCLAISLLLLISLVSAIGISMSPGKIDIDNLLRDGYAERDVKIMTQSEEPYEIILGWDDTEIKNWVKIYDEESDIIDFNESFMISKESPLIIKIVIEPPFDVENGDYIGHLFARSNFEKEQTITGTSLQIAVALLFNLKITDNQVIACRAEIQDIADTEQGVPAYVPILVYNDGNVRFAPKISLDVWDYVKKTKHKSIVFEEVKILPSIGKLINVPIETDSLVPGQYFVDVFVEECNVKKELSFDVFEPGKNPSEGEVLEIRSEVRSIVGDPTIFTAIFKNTGDKGYYAQFKGNLWLDSSIQDIVNSDEFFVKPGKTIEFEIPARTKNTGLHYLKGSVYFDKKRTKEQSVALKVFPESMRAEVEAANKENQSKNTNYFTYIGIALVILILLILIQRRKQKKKRKHF